MPLARIPDQALGLRQVYAAALFNDESEREAAVDIVAIHGKGANPVNTWGALRSSSLDAKKQANWINWLEDKEMLPAEFPTARILRYGYPSDWFGEHAIMTRAGTIAENLLDELNAMRIEHIDRPIMFIAHSFGGLVLLKTLLLSRHGGRKWKSIFDSTLGVVFLGTPFHGVHETLHVDILHEAESSVGKTGVMQENHRASKAGNDWLTELFIEFTKMLHKGSAFKIACFYEQKATDVGLLLRNVGNFSYEKGKYKVILVSQSSATLESREQLIGNYPRACDHFELNKYSSPQSPEWKTLVRVLTEMKQAKTPLEEADAYIADHCYNEKKLRIERLSGDPLNMEQCYINLTIVQGSPQVTTVIKHSKAEKQSPPFSRVARLKVERPDKDREILLETLFDPRKIHNEKARRPCRILIRGRAGMGKTTLCKKIVHQFIHRKMWRRKFSRILWVPLRNLKLRDRCRIPEYNLRDLLSHEFFTDSPKMEVLVNILRQDLEATSGGNTLFILDGLDEVSNDLEGNMQRFLEELLNYPNVIVTSRPHSTLPSRVDPVDLEVETIGFYQEQVTEYISKIFSDMPHIGADVSSFLQDHRLMQDLIRIPVQLNALCYIWKDLDDRPIPQTMTAIYHTIESSLWRKDGVKLGRFRSTQNVFRRTLEASMLNERQFLEALAFTGMYNNTVDFTLDHQDRILDEVLETKTLSLDGGLSQLSFLRTSNPTSRTEDQQYHFLHLTYEEYFAARYFVRQWMGKTKLSCYSWSRGREKVSCHDFIQKFKYDTRYDIMWRFITGLLDARADDEVERFFQIIEQEPVDVLGPAHQRLVMHCLSEAVSLKPGLRSQCEERLARWSLFEFDFHGTSYLATEPELPEGVLRQALLSGSTEHRKGIFDSVEHMSRDVSEPTIRLMLRFLKDHNWNVQSAAARTIGRHHNLPESVAMEIAALLDDEESTVREAAASAMCGHPTLSDAAVTELVTLLKDKEQSVREVAAEAIDRQPNLPDSAVTKLTPLLKDDQSSVRAAAVEAIGRQSSLPEPAVTVIAALLKDEDWFTRKAAAKVICKQASLPESAVIELTALLKSKDRNVRTAVAEAIGKQPGLPASVVTELVTLLKHEKKYVRDVAAEVIGRQPSLPEPVVTELAALIKSKDRNVQEAAAGAVARQSDLPGSAVAELIALLKDKSHLVRRRVSNIVSSEGWLLAQVLSNFGFTLQPENSWPIPTSTLEVSGFLESLYETLLCRNFMEDLVFLQSWKNLLRHTVIGDQGSDDQQQTSQSIQKFNLAQPEILDFHDAIDALGHV